MTESGQAADRSGASGAIVPLVVIVGIASAALLIGPNTPGRMRAVGFAAAVCGMGALAAWAVSASPRTSPAGRVAASLAATSLRLAPALVALGWLQAAGGALAAEGAGGYLVIFYLAALAAEVIRTIMEARRGARRRGANDTI